MDELVIGGDLCDFWFVARESTKRGPLCAGLRALADFRERGGHLVLVAGNHDAWLGPFYREALGVDFAPEPWERTVHGLRVHLIHGHRAGGRPFWKGAMESRPFLAAFSAAPGLIARRLAARLDQSNDATRAESDHHHRTVYERYAADLGERADLVLFGHIHMPHDRRDCHPRWCVLGGWQRRSSYLRIDESGAELVVIEAGPPGG